MADIAGAPMLARVVTRASRASLLDSVSVATTQLAGDDVIARWCDSAGLACFRGSEGDVLDRYYQAARGLQADVVVRLTADCPLIDPDVVDTTVRAFLMASPPLDFAANRLPTSGRTYPIGLDTEVCRFAALEAAWREADQPHQREHVMPFLYEAPARFRILRVDHPVDYGSYRWTVDTPEDLAVVRRVFEAFSGRDDFGWLEVVALFERDPSLAAMNASVRQRTHLDVG
jgi:spore coat polysaccharide biosynthesis protein SpsF